MPDDIKAEKGLKILSVANDSAAAGAGFEIGDILLSYDGKRVANSGSLDAARLAASEKDEVAVTLVRDRQVVNVSASSGRLGVNVEEAEAEISIKLINPKAHKVSKIPFVTSSRIVGVRIVKTLGMARGSTVRGKHVGKDMMADIKNIVGGEMKGYTEMLAEAREEAIYRMKLDALELGANAIVDVRFSTSTIASQGIGGGAAEMLAYGTAVMGVREQNDG